MRMRSPSTAEAVVTDRRGLALVEFALILPLFLTLLLGMMAYGQYFLLAHSAQQLANDAARATIGGMSSAERLSLANAMLTRELANVPEIRPGTVALAIDEAAPVLTARVRVDASAVPLMRMTFVPLPDPTIERRAVVRMGDGW